MVRTPLFAVCLAATALAGCGGGPTCASGDFGCFIANLSITSDGAPVSLIAVDATAFSGLLTGAATKGAPSIDKGLPWLQLSSDAPQTVEIDWTDPGGAQPAMCWVCIQTPQRNIVGLGAPPFTGQPCATLGGTPQPIACIDWRPDNLLKGRRYFTFTFHGFIPGNGVFSSNVLPLGSPDGVTSPLAARAAGKAPIVGAPVPQSITVQDPKAAPITDDAAFNTDPGGGGGGGGGGGNPLCYSTSGCLPRIDHTCSCTGRASESQCAGGHPACSAVGGPCDDGVHACCVGETCIYSSCVAGCGQCAGMGCAP